MTYFSEDPLGDLIVVYFGQDHSYHGDTIEEIMDAYLLNGMVANDDHLVIKIQDFMREHESDLEEVFAELFRYDMEPALWGYSVRSFLEKVLFLISSARAEKLKREIDSEPRG